MASASTHYPIDTARQDLGTRLHAALTAMLPEGGTLSLTPEAIGRLLERPPEAKMGDYALPCFRFAKELKKKPPEIAEALARTLRPGGWLSRADAFGAFLNLTVDPGTLAAAVVGPALANGAFKQLARPPSHAARRVMIEFSQPNTHKELHVGHGRNVCLGNAMVRLYRYCGYDVVAANYPGDDGTHIAIELWHIKKSGATAPAGGPVEKNAWLNRMYVEARRALEAQSETERAATNAEISQVHREIEKKTGEVHRLWEETRAWSIADFKDLYVWLGVDFDVYFYESEVGAPAQAIVDEFLGKGVFVLDQGAVGVDLKPFKLGFCILRKSDGNTLYATKDLALARRKFEEFKIDRSIYVVGDEQNHHFRQVFKVLELMGFPQAAQCHHLSYGMVTLPEGKMSSRTGTTVSFRQLLGEVQGAVNKILTKYDGDWTPAEIAEAAHRLADGSIKFGMVSTDPQKELVFVLADWVSFEGVSGPYLMYGYSRVRSILRKATELGYKADPSAAAELTAETETELLRHLYDFDQVVAAAAETYKPSLLATHLYYTCKAFNRFYVDVPVLKAQSPRLLGARLALIDAFGRCLAAGLGLLGIVPPERM